MPVIYPILYVRTKLDAAVDILEDVTDHQRRTLLIRTGTYRNKPSAGFGKSEPWGPLVSNTTLTQQTAVPVVGTPDVAVGGTVSAMRAQLRYVADDEALGIEPRPAWSLESAHVFSVGEGNTLPAPRALVKTFTRVGDTCSSVAHGFVTGDVVMVHTNSALPGGLLASVLYFVVVVSADLFRLVRVDTNTPVTMTSAGSGTHTAVLKDDIWSTEQAGFHYYLDAWKPRFSTKKPIL